MAYRAFCSERSAASRFSRHRKAGPLHPANRMTDGTKKALNTLSKLRADLEKEIPKDGYASRSSDAVVLHSPSSVYGKDMAKFALNARVNLTPLVGAHRMLIDGDL